MSTKKIMSRDKAGSNLKIEIWPIAKVKPYGKNAKLHPDEQIDKLAHSIQELGFDQPIAVDRNGVIIKGHGRLLAAKKIGMQRVPVVVRDDLPPAKIKAARLADNKLAETGWDWDVLRDDVLGAMNDDGFDLSLTGFTEDEFKLDDDKQPKKASMLDKFLVPPFSVLDARQGYWQDRKRQWLALGIKSELGRAEDTGSTPQTLAAARGMNLPDRLLGAKEARASFKNQDKLAAFQAGERRWKKSKNSLAERIERTGDDEAHIRAGFSTGTSIFDPVLCELAYRWFSPKDARVLDPFAGGSVRGVVAAWLGRRYTGIDLRAEQIDANKQQWRDIGDKDKPTPKWIEGDSLDVAKLAPGSYDFLFSCPPYGDLEVYSEDPRDISNHDYDRFLAAYGEIVGEACKLLANDSFACFVVGNYRGPRGSYRNLVADTCDAFKLAGLDFYNDAILVTAVGSLPVRAGRQFAAGRKLGRTHQNVLVFVKGDAKRATERCGAITIEDDFGTPLELSEAGDNVVSEEPDPDSAL
jgi:ParB-like nuclease domain